MRVPHPVFDCFRRMKGEFYPTDGGTVVRSKAGLARSQVMWVLELVHAPCLVHLMIGTEITVCNQLLAMTMI